jgi:NAD(P)-dependent dehydrogenase (short-subunit alcohol dehydrogenase family)
MLSPSPIFNDQNPKFLRKIKEVIPMEILANKEDLNSSILYLLDDKNNFITGQNIIVDGGRTIV